MYRIGATRAIKDLLSLAIAGNPSYWSREVRLCLWCYL